MNKFHTNINNLIKIEHQLILSISLLLITMNTSLAQSKISINHKKDVPQLIVSTNYLSGFATIQGTVSETQTYEISGTNLTDDIIVSVLQNFEISKTSPTDGFSSSITIQHQTGIVENTIIYVRISANSSIGSISEEILNTSSGSVEATVTVDGFVTPNLQTLINFNFEDRDTIADDGIPGNNLMGIFSVGTSSNTTYTDGTGGSGTYAITKSGWNLGMYIKDWQIVFTTLGYRNLTISSKQKSSTTGPRNFKLQYKIGINGDYIDIPSGNITCSATNYSLGTTNNLPLPAACENQPVVFLRWVVTSLLSVNNSLIQNSGTSSIDDIDVKGYYSGFSGVFLTNFGTPPQGYLNPATINAPILGFMLSPYDMSYDFNAVSISTTGTVNQSDISNFRIVYDENENGIFDTNDIIVSESAMSLSNNLIFNIIGQNAIEQTRRYLLIADIENNATLGTTITANISDGSMITANGNIFGMANGNEQTIGFEPENKSIFEIQFTTDQTGASPIVNQIVKTKGVVTGIIASTGFFLQDGGGAWKSIYVYDEGTNDLAIGDSVFVTGMVSENDNCTNLRSYGTIDVRVTFINSQNTVQDAIELLTENVKQEMYECVLVKVENALSSIDNYLWIVNDGSGNLMVENRIENYSPFDNHYYAITGFGFQSQNDYLLIPRSANDIIDITTNFDFLSQNKTTLYPNPASDYITIANDFSDYQIKIFNCFGQLLQIIESKNINNKQIDISKYPTGFYQLVINNQKQSFTYKLLKIK